MTLCCGELFKVTVRLRAYHDTTVLNCSKSQLGSERTMILQWFNERHITDGVAAAGIILAGIMAGITNSEKIPVHYVN